MKFDYIVMVRFNGKYTNFGANDYMHAWELYRLMCERFPKEANIDIIDNSTGEVFQSNDEDWM